MIRLLRKYFSRRLLLCAIAGVGCMCLEVYMDLQQPAFLSKIVNTGIAAGDMDYVLRTGGIMLLCALLGVLGGSSNGILISYVTVSIGGSLRKSLYRKIQQLSAADVDSLETSMLITNLTNDVMQMQNMVTVFFRGMVRSPLLCIGGVIMSFLLSPRLALIFCVIIPVLITASYVIVTRTVPMYTKVQTGIDRMNTVIRENLLGIRVIKAFSIEKERYRRFTDVNEALTESSVRAQKATFTLMPFVTCIMNLGVVAILWFGGIMEINGVLESGIIIALVNYMIQITNAFVGVVNMVVNISRAGASAVRLNDVLEKDSSMREAEKTQLPENCDIRFDKVSFRYGRGEYNLKNIDLAILEGTKVGIIGATGCGKSTLAALLCRLYDATEGSVSIGGVDVREIPQEVLHRITGIVLQESILFSGTIAENIGYGNAELSLEEVKHAAAVAAADEFLEKLPKQYESEVGQRGKNFSGGQKQRISIARTLASNPQILILDDSTSALDMLTEAKLQKAISESRKDKTVLIIAQRISSIMNCDRILVMDKGCIYAQGTHQELLEHCDIYRQIAVSQLGEGVTAHGSQYGTA